MGMQTDVRIVEAQPEFVDETLRTPLKFGSGLVREITSCRVRVRVENARGKIAEGLGNILLSDLWAWPGPLPHEVRDRAMRELARLLCRRMAASPEPAHPLDHFLRLEGELEDCCAEAARASDLDAPVPRLAGLVCLSPIDAAVHDACAVAAGVSAYALFGPEFIRDDLARFIGPLGRGFHADVFLTSDFVPRIPVWHLVGGVDKLRRSEKSPEDPEDGLPVSLDEWIERDGIFCFKVKLRGNDVDWDVERTAQVAEVAAASLARLGARRQFYLSVDSNEMSPSPEAVVEYLRKLRQRSPEAWRALLYVEQPTERDLEAHQFDMHAVAQLKPVLADEGIVDLEKIDVAHRLGWSGLALKTCKGHSAAVLAVAKAARLGMVWSVQDLTNVGLGLVHSAGLAARVNPLKGVEYNSRQFLPAAEPGVRAAHPRLFRVEGGLVRTREVTSTGLGYGARCRSGR